MVLTCDEPHPLLRWVCVPGRLWSRDVLKSVPPFRAKHQSSRGRLLQELWQRLANSGARSMAQRGGEAASGCEHGAVSGVPNAVVANKQLQPNLLHCHLCMRHLAPQPHLPKGVNVGRVTVVEPALRLGLG
jgi:hypothetical protein